MDIDPKSYFLNPQTGLATLPTILALAILVLAIVVGVTTWALSESFITQGQTNSQLALFYAEAGARDALTRITRNPSYTSVGYDIDMVSSGCGSGLSGCASVTVTTGTPVVVASTGKVKTITRRVQVNVTINADGEITNTAWSELTN